MPRVVTLPSATAPRGDETVAGGWWHDDPDDGRLVCDLCPRACRLKPGDRGFCFVRQNLGGEMVLTTFGKSTGFCVDPIEKKPLNHFYPGTSVLSFGTAGCNLGCKFCQNWDISKSREVERLSEDATPDAIAEAARSLGCKSVAFTYNDPVIWAEYAIETARACRAAGVKTVAVTAGYVTPEARGPFFEVMDAANVDLKGFSERFYQQVTSSHLRPVLDTLAWLKAETDVWFEITNLMIPGENDDPDEVRAMASWILERCGDEVPVHFTAFHPDFRMRDRPGTPKETLIAAREAARAVGLKHVYVGNVHDAGNQSTYCPHCSALLIERDWYALGRYELKGDRCGRCGGGVAGRFDDRPGDWGRKRLPVAIARYAPTAEPRVVTIGSKPPTDPGRPAMTAAPTLDDDQKARTLAAASAVVAGAVLGRAPAVDDPTLAGASEFPVSGAYVTLKRRGRLRGCCGFVGASKPLGQALRESAAATALRDPRFPPVSATELLYLDLEVNLLFGQERVGARGRDRIGAVEVGRHGLRVERGGGVGLLLPGVATEHGWDAEQFLRAVARKAGLPTAAWEDDEAVLFTFESVEFGAAFDPGVLPAGPAAPEFVAPDALARLAAYAGENVGALLSGRAAHYYAPGLPDGNVGGLALSVATPDRPSPVHAFQLALRGGVPLQATLYGLAESAAKTLARSDPRPRGLRVGLTLLNDPALHGSADAPDLRGVDPARRALLLVENGKSALAFAPARSAQGLFDAASGAFDVLNPARAELFSLEARSTEAEVVFGLAPRAVADGPEARPPAVAGTFYPAGPAALADAAGALLGGSARAPGRWAAAMLPHAGWAFSGKLAAAVLNRLEIPEVVIVIGPKHTRLGVDWAVAPHAEWAFPGGRLASDPGLARALAGSIPGLKLDAAAHRKEHAIEVEIPLIARLAPGARVVGVALGGGPDWEPCRRFAEGLARAIERLPARPLLLVSSDMNHFANDDETRRLDRTALDAMARLDPERLLSTVVEHGISMCGVVPAAVVMETLRRLGGLRAFEEVGYATSAGASGNSDRVVGYAGVLLD